MELHAYEGVNGAHAAFGEVHGLGMGGRKPELQVVPGFEGAALGRFGVEGARVVGPGRVGVGVKRGDGGLECRGGPIDEGLGVFPKVGMFAEQKKSDVKGVKFHEEYK